VWREGEQARVPVEVQLLEVQERGPPVQPEHPVVAPPLCPQGVVFQGRLELRSPPSGVWKRQEGVQGV
jgi:hypothetical protein